MNLLKRSLATRTVSLVVSLVLLASSSSAKTTNSAVAPGQLKKQGRGQTKNCKGRKCAIDTSKINIATDEQIELVGLGANQKTIQCRKKMLPVKGKAKSWYA